MTLNIIMIRFQREASGIVWDAESSETFCSEYVRQSPVYNLCSGIPHARPDEAIDNCALDLQVCLPISRCIAEMSTFKAASKYTDSIANSIAFDRMIILL